MEKDTNWNRTCMGPVQLGPVRSKSFILGSVCTTRLPKMTVQNPDVAARWQRKGSFDLGLLTVLLPPNCDCITSKATTQPN
jgi:hypothetical protein